MARRGEELSRAAQRRPLMSVPGRAALVRIVRLAYRALLPLDPSPRLLRRRTSHVRPGPFGLVCVYRTANAARVQALLRGLPADARIALWGLDGVADDLAPWTLGSGPGRRGTHVNRLVAHLDDPAQTVVVCDDDVALPPGGLAALVATCRTAGLDLAQPAHAPTSAVSWRFTRRRPLVLARSTGFVEIGPVVVMSPAAQERLLPLPEQSGMSWGLEAAWAQHRPPLRFGIVDAIALRHLEPVASTYSGAAETDRRDSALEAFDTTMIELQVDHGVWRPWQRTAPWLAGD